MQMIENRRENVEANVLVNKPVNQDLAQAFLKKMVQDGGGTAPAYFLLMECVEGVHIDVIEGEPVFECMREELAEAENIFDFLSMYSYSNNAGKPTIFCVDKERGLTALDEAAEDYTYLEQVMYEILSNENTMIFTFRNEEEVKTAQELAEKNKRLHNVKIFTTQYANPNALN